MLNFTQQHFLDDNNFAVFFQKLNQELKFPNTGFYLTLLPCKSRYSEVCLPAHLTIVSVIINKL